MKIFLVALLFVGGCAKFSSTVSEYNIDGTEKITRVNVYTFWDSKSEVAKIRSSQTDKTQGVSVGAINQEASVTNSIIESAITAAIRATTKP